MDHTVRARTMAACLTSCKILKIRNGPGSAILPPSLTRIHLTFANNVRGHVGPKFANPLTLLSV